MPKFHCLECDQPLSSAHTPGCTKDLRRQPNRTTHARAVRDAIERLLDAVATGSPSEADVLLSAAREASRAAQGAAMTGPETVLADYLAECAFETTVHMRLSGSATTPVNS